MRLALALWTLLTLAAIGPTQAVAENERKATGLVTIEGTVIAVGESTLEGDLPTITVSVEMKGEPPREVLLAPAPVLADAGFDVQVGDRLRARVFAGGDSGVVHTQKVMNVSRKLILRLRTLRNEPLWDTAGRWQGSNERPHRATRRRRVRTPTRRRPPPSRPPTRPQLR